MHKILFYTLLFSIFSVHLSGQQTHNPLSSLGFGEFLDNTQTAVASTGWNKAVFNEYYHVNLSNPVSYGYLQSTSFELGVYGKFNTYTNNSSSYKAWQGNINSISLAFPMLSPYNELLDRKDRKFKWGMGFGLSPFSSIDYNYQLDYQDVTVGSYYQQHQGKGGYYKLHWNNGFLYKKFGVGLGLDYLFGNSTRNSILYFKDLVADNVFNYIYKNQTYLNGLQFNLGANYTYELNPMTAGKRTDPERLKKLVFGVYYQPATNIKARQTASLYSNAPAVGVTDTIYEIENQVLKGKFYSEYGAGIQYRSGENLKLNINYSANQFDKATILDFNKSYRNAAIFSVGGEYCPDPGSYVSFFRRVKYRAGFRTGTLPLLLDDIQTTVTSGIIGFGLPVFVNRQISHVNIGAEFGKKSYGAGFTESFINISLGLNINDDYWFLKRKFD